MSQTKFVVDGDTVEVHPYILVTPLEKNPVIAAIENIGEVPVAVDIWQVFGGITIPAQTTPVIEPHTQITYKYEFITPDLPKGLYPCTFYIGKFGERVDDEFTQPAIRITDVIIGIDYGFYDIKTPEVVTQNQKAEITIPMKIDWIRGAESAVLDVWTIRDKDKFYAELFSEDVTIVDDKILEIMMKYTIGITHTKTITKGLTLNHIHEFTIPPDLPLGKHTFCVFFGKYDDYFLGAAGFSGHSFDATVLPDKITILEFIEKFKQTRIREIDIDVLSSCIHGWFLGGADSIVSYEERGWQITIEPKIPSATILHNWVEQEHIETEIANRVLQDIAKIPPPISYKQPISTEAIMIYSRAIKEHIRATNEFPVVKKQFREMLSKGFALSICACQLSYAILRPLTHWIETPTFVDPFSEWYYYAQEGIYWELEKCTTKECVEKYLDDFWANMKKLNAQLPNVKTPAIIISSPVTLSAKIEVFDGEWVTVGENIENLTIKICEEGETHIKFYSVKHPDWAEDTELTEMINVVGEISYTFDPSNIPRKKITINSVPLTAKLFVDKKQIFI